jgi:hypothetical protein
MASRNKLGQREACHSLALSFRLVQCGVFGLAMTHARVPGTMEALEELAARHGVRGMALENRMSVFICTKSRFPGLAGIPRYGVGEAI